ncbi:MAG: c-type cytochrome [Paracoccaceae bacterium]|nr:c-type cytochrome [Paracoccaceae bacterium]
MQLAGLIGLGGVFLAQIFAQTAAAQTLVGDPAAGRQKAGVCRTCHGLDGYAKIPIAPHIGGEHPAYILHQLTAFRSGARVHEMMSVVAAGLDDQAIADLAAWYGSQTVVATLPDGMTEDAAPQACVACHGAEGLAQIEDAPNLAGENVIYIDTQLKAFRTGKRKHEIMSEIAAGLSDAEIRAFAGWYGATGITISPPAQP